MNSKKKMKISEYLKRRNVKRFSLFVVIAFVFLIFSKLSNDYKQTINLKVNLINIDDEIILNNDSLNTMEALIEAKGFALIPFVFKDSKEVVLDAKTDIVTMPEYYIFDVQKHRFLIEGQLGSAYKVLSLKPDTLLLSYSTRASKYVPVVIKTSVDFAAGYDIIGDYELSIDSVKVVGSSEKVNEIQSISTEELTLQEVNSNISRNLNFEGLQDIEVFPKNITVKAEVKRFTEGTIECPITIINKPDNVEINYFPKTVTITYYVDLDNYNAIDASDFRVECDYEALGDDQSFLVPKIVKKPEFVKRTAMKQKRIDFIKL
ncbi:YbbR-like domain-containing protein [Winogradskyella sp.]|uniref:YbbR-like domain-containing protein n=1 Tax=Winogradskyella sp. TaxID=1883156 RepID=UPI001B21929D|nr:YbbR-like domain-containing protein [Winogradskyella sp.]MBO6880140.1 YbbR-like domain-containing protein [Winogradskyella sp.]